MAAWAVFLIVFGCIGAVALAGYAAYRLRIRNAMHQEIRSIMAQYMPLGEHSRSTWCHIVPWHGTCYLRALLECGGVSLVSVAQPCCRPVPHAGALAHMSATFICSKLLMLALQCLVLRTWAHNLLPSGGTDVIRSLIVTTV